MQNSIRTGYLALVFALGLIFSGCGSNEDRSITEARKKAAEISRIEAIQAAISGGYINDLYFPLDITYVRDDRAKPALCYAYIWGGSSHGGPGLAEVSCENVRHLLAPSQQRKMEQEQAAR